MGNLLEGISIADFNKLLAETQCNPLGVSQENKGDTIFLTTQELAGALKGFFNDKDNEQYKKSIIKEGTAEYIYNGPEITIDKIYQNATSIINLLDRHAHNWTKEGEFEFSEFYYGKFIIDLLKKYKPLQQKSEPHFVVEM